MGYVELHACSAFSFLRGGSFPEHIAETAAEREHGIRPIVGCDLVMADGAILPVLVQTRTGYANLCQLLTQAHLRSEKGNCTVEWQDLPDFAEGLVALFGVTASALSITVTPTSSVRDANSAPYSSADRLQCVINTFG